MIIFLFGKKVVYRRFNPSNGLYYYKKPRLETQLVHNLRSFANKTIPLFKEVRI
jgi:hypothetical protein